MSEFGDISGLLGLHLEHLMQQRCLFLLLRPKAKGICSGGATPSSKSMGWFLVKILHFCNHVSRTCVLLKTLKAFQILSERPSTSKIFIAVWRHRVLHTWTFKHSVCFFKDVVLTHNPMVWDVGDCPARLKISSSCRPTCCVETIESHGFWDPPMTLKAMILGSPHDFRNHQIFRNTMTYHDPSKRDFGRSYNSWSTAAMFTAMVAWIVRLSCNFSGTNSSVWQLKGYLKRIENMFQNVVEDFYVLLSPIIQMYPDISRCWTVLSVWDCLDGYQKNKHDVFRSQAIRVTTTQLGDFLVRGLVLQEKHLVLTGSRQPLMEIRAIGKIPLVDR
jgi:hypothetical protein